MLGQFLAPWWTKTRKGGVSKAPSQQHVRFEFHHNQVSASEEFSGLFSNRNVLPYQHESWFIHWVGCTTCWIHVSLEWDSCDLHILSLGTVNTLRPRQDGRHFPDDIFKSIFMNENVWISIKISLKFVPKGPINNIPALVQIMAWRRPGDKPLSEPMVVRLPTHICVTRPQWVN